MSENKTVIGSDSAPVPSEAEQKSLTGGAGLNPAANLPAPEPVPSDLVPSLFAPTEEAPQATTTPIEAPPPSDSE